MCAHGFLPLRLLMTPSAQIWLVTVVVFLVMLGMTVWINYAAI